QVTTQRKEWRLMQHGRSAVHTTSQQGIHLALQTASRDAIAAHQVGRLRAGMQHLLSCNPFYQRKLAGCDLARFSDLDAVVELPFTTKGELVKDQRDHPPYGTNLTYPLRDYVRLHQTSGTSGQPLKVLDTQQSWDWWTECWAAVYHAAGVTACELG